MLQKKQLTMGTLLFKKLCMQLEELSESKVTDKNVGGDYCEKMKLVLEEAMPVNTQQCKIKTLHFITLRAQRIKGWKLTQT